MKPFKIKIHRGAMSDCPTCRKLQGLAPKAVKKNYKQNYKNYSARFKPVQPQLVPVQSEAQPAVPVAASVEEEVRLY